jgi:uncharacterized protein (DUF362 family)
MKKKEKVFLRKIDAYDPVKAEKIIRDGLQDFGLTSQARGKITIKPNVVMAHHKVAPSAYTRPEFLEGVMRALQTSSEDPPSITIAEKCGAGIPTTRMFRRAGYYKLKKRNKFKLRPIELSRKKSVFLEKGKVHKKISTSQDILERDFLLYTPKLKSNSLSQGMTGAVKLNVGILLDIERMWNHNFKLDEKIVDLLEVGNPDFIATDAIEVSLGGNHLTQHGRHLGLIIMASNAVAHDVVCSHIFHLDPEKIGHLRAAHERGYGPIKLEDIEICGDTALTDIQEKTKNWDLGYIRADEVDCGIKVLCGEPYCIGGCHGVMLDWLYMIKDRKPKLWKKLPPWTIVMGKYKGDVSADKLMLIGSCTEIQGKVRAKKKRKIKGCPPKHKDLVLWFFLKTGIVNPLFRLDLIIDAYGFLFLTWFKRFITMRF